MSRRRRNEVVCDCEEDCACEEVAPRGNEPKFYIDEKKQTVVCIFSDCRNDALKFIDKVLDDERLSADYRVRRALTINDKFIGKAKCSGGDVFDVNTGKSIAMSKAKLKYYKAMFSVIERFYVQFLMHETNIESKIEKKLARLNKLKWDHIGNINKHRDENDKIEFYDSDCCPWDSECDPDDIPDSLLMKKVRALKNDVQSVEDYENRIKNANKLFGEVCKMLGRDPEEIRKMEIEIDDDDERVFEDGETPLASVNINTDKVKSLHIDIEDVEDEEIKKLEGEIEDGPEEENA